MISAAPHPTSLEMNYTGKRGEIAPTIIDAGGGDAGG
jgi:hypothetical protein